MTVTRTPGPDAAKLKQLIDDAKRMSVQIGWTEAARYEDGTPVAYVASVHEFGAPKASIPPRPFMRPTAEEKKAAWAALGARLIKRALKGEGSIHEAYDTLGFKVAGDIARAIKKIREPELSRTTLMLRKMRKMGLVDKVTGRTVGEAAAFAAGETSKITGVSTKPLVDTGYMLTSLTHNVVDGGDAK